MGGADIPCELCGEFAEFDDILDIKANVSILTPCKDQHAEDEANEQIMNLSFPRYFLLQSLQLEDSQEDLEVQKSIRILKDITPITSSDRPPPAPKDRLVAFEKRPLHLLSPHADRDFTIFAALTKSGEQIYDNNWYGGEESKICSKPSSPKSCPAKHIIALSSKQGPDGGCAGALSIPGTSATSGFYDSPWIVWTFSDALSMFCSITKRSPQLFYAAVQWSIAFNGDEKQTMRVTGEIGDNWNSDDYFDAGPIVRSEQYPNLLDYVLRGYQRPWVGGGPNITELKEEVNHKGTHPSVYRFKRAIDGKLGKEGPNWMTRITVSMFACFNHLKLLHRLKFFFFLGFDTDIALWEYWNDYGNMHNFALRSL